MNSKQQKALMGLAAAIILMIVYPPWQRASTGGTVFNEGYSWIFEGR